MATLLGLAGLAVCASLPLAGQDAALGTLEEQHRNAVRQYDLAVEVAADQRRVWEDWLTTMEQARTALEEARSQGSATEIEAASREYEAAYRQLETAFRELQRMEARVGELRDRVDATRRDLLSALEGRLQSLEARFAALRDPAESERVRNQILDVTAEYQRLRDQALVPDASRLLYTPSITLDPRDGPSQLQFKALYLERRVAEADSAIARTGRELERLRALQRTEQSSGDFRAGLDRFGDTRLPTGPPRPTNAGEGVIPADSAAVQDAVPLEDQIRETLQLRERLHAFREATARRAEEFRERLRRITE